LIFDNSLETRTNVIDFATDYIDYDTFTFVASAGQTLNNNVLTITNKGVATFNIADKSITYTKNTATVGNIPIVWKVKNECDIFSQEFTLNVNSVESIEPAVNNITKTLFLGDTSITTVTGNTTISKLEIISNPVVGTISIVNNVVTYIPVNYSATNQVVTLRPVNQYGKVGNSFTITYTILSPGVARPLTTCSGLTNYNLFNLLITGTYTAGGTWTTSSGLQINNNQVTVVNSGVYNFTYTVTNPVDSSTKSVTTSINYVNFSISNVAVTYDTNNSRKVKITTAGFTPTQLESIRYVNVNIISPSGTLPITNNVLDSKSNDILFTTIDLTNPDNTVKTDYTSIEVIIPSELNDCNNSITGTYNKTPKVLSSTLTASVTVAATITKIQEVVVSLTSTLTASVTMNNPQIYVSVNRFTFDADYLMVQYEFTDGQDLDTRTRVVTPDIGQDTTVEYIGYGANYCSSANYSTNGIYPPASGSNYILKHACDNTGTGFEAVLINLNNFTIAYPSENNITIDCRGWWYNSVGTNPVKLNVTLWKGGTIVPPTFNNPALATHFTFTNPTATGTLEIKSSGSTVQGPNVGSTTAPNNNEAYRIGVIKYNLSTNVCTINNADTTTPCIGSC